MKVPSVFEPSLGEWLNSVPARDGIAKKWLRDLFSRDLLCQGATELREALSNAESEEWKSQLYDLEQERRLVWARVGALSPSLCLSAGDKPEVRDQKLSQIDSLTRDLRRGINRNENRSNYFARIFQAMFERAKLVEVFDPYAATNLNLKGGSLWLLDQAISSNLDLSFHFFTFDLTEDSRLGNPFSSRLERIRSSIVEVISQHHGYTGAVRVTHAFSRFDMHDRNLNFIFDSGEIKVSVGKGISIFDKEVASDDFDVLPNESKSLMTLKSQFRKNRNTEFDIEVLHTDTCAACSLTTS